MTESASHDNAAGVSLDDLDIDRLAIAPGFELKEHEVYLDLANPGHGPFRALPGQTAGSGNRYVAEADVDQETWNLLVRRDAEAAPERNVTPDPTTTSV